MKHLKYVRKFLVAIRKIRKHYSGYPANDIIIAYGIKYPESCPLCTVLETIRDSCDSGLVYTQECPWFIFEGEACDGPFRNQTNKQAIARLNRWEKKILKQLGR